MSAIVSAARAPASLATLLLLAWPIIVSRSTQVVIGLTDSVLVADLGQNALAATTAGGFNAFVLLMLPMGICFIVSSFAAQLHGRGDLAGARRYGYYGLGVAALTQLVGLAGMPLVGGALAQLGYDPEVRQLIETYLLIRLAASGPAIGMEALASYYGGIGDTRTPMLANVFAMVLNVALSILLINGYAGLPALGVAGAAWGSALATSVAFAALLARFVLTGKNLGGWWPALQWREFGRMLRFGLPSGLNWFFEFMAFNFFINVVVAGLGTTALAAMGAVFQVNSVSFMPAFGLASAGAILVGQAIGEQEKHRVPRILAITFAAAAVWQCAVGLLYLLMPELLLASFLPTDKPVEAAALLATGVRMLMLSAAWQIFDAAAATVAETLRAAGDTAFALWARVVIAWLLFVPGSWYTVRVLGGGDLVAVGWIVGYLGLLAIVLAWRFYSGAWRNIELVEEVPPV
jgi:MATE family multidrug resistance protein